MRNYGSWRKNLQLIELYESFRDDPEVQQQLLEGTGSPEGRADFPLFLQTVIRHKIRERFTAVSSKWKSYMGTETAQDFRPNTVSQLNGIRGIAPKAEDQEFARLHSSEEKGAPYSVGTHGGIYSVTRELVINDQVDYILNRAPRELGQSAADYISQVAAAFIESNPDYVDGQPFFSNAHANQATGADAAPNEDNLAAIVTAMTLRRDSDNVPITVQPNRIVTKSPLTKLIFDRIIRSQTTGTTINDGAADQFDKGNYNSLYNILPPDAVIVEPWLNDANDWIVFANAQERPAFLVAFLQGNEAPFVGLKDPGVRNALGSGDDPYSMEFDSIDFKVRLDFGVAVGEPLAAYRAVPS